MALRSRPIGFFSTLPVALALLVITHSPSRAQVSPGPLSRAHHALEGNSRCFECHETGRGATDAKCLGCHTETKWAVENQRGLHGLEAKARCTSCHPEHAGQDFLLIDWGKGGTTGFDHAKAGWPLTGKHAGRPCADCHKPAFQVSPVMPLLKRKEAARSWMGLERGCAACHRDTHEGRLGPVCETCHSTSRWQEVPSTGFAHEKTRYPLEGLHAKVECEKCHGSGAGRNARPGFATCGSCHRDPHVGGSTLEGKVADCATCHTVAGFSPATFSISRHDASAYPLRGAHRNVKCAGCHRTPRAASGPPPPKGADVVLKPRHDRCTSCHPDAHGKQLAHRADQGACESCHKVDGWKPSTFDAAAHSASGFALEGRHAAARCDACHGTRREGLPPLPAGPEGGETHLILNLGKTKCADCHQDPHQGRYPETAETGFPAGCNSCHDYKTFRPSHVDLAMHARLGVVLEGSHRAVPCFDCHAELTPAKTRSSLLLAAERIPALPFTSRRTKCVDCHATPHGDQFASRLRGETCDTCHDQERFRPAPRFDHNRDSDFSLVGAHAKVKCEKCHPGTKNAAGLPATVYRPVSKECRSCHAGSRIDSLRTGSPGGPGR